jgi:hypothetical protein
MIKQVETLGQKMNHQQIITHLSVNGDVFN